jgi:hypothetical protein
MINQNLDVTEFPLNTFPQRVGSIESLIILWLWGVNLMFPLNTFPQRVGSFPIYAVLPTL